jgi:hypothetical protein
MTTLCNGHENTHDGRGVISQLAARSDLSRDTYSQNDVCPVMPNVSSDTESDSQPHACGLVACRVCIALGFLPQPAAARLPGKTHPLSTPRASARAQRVLEAFLAFQAEHSRPPRLREVFRQCGFANYGLMSRYLQLLEIQGKARRVPRVGRGRWRFGWEVIR